MYYRLFFLSLCWLLMTMSGIAQPSIGNVYVNSPISAIHSAESTSSNGAILAGWDFGNGWLLRVDDQSDTLWVKHFYTADELYHAIPTSDGGFVATGDEYYVKVDATGQIIWRHSRTDLQCRTIRETSDGGYLLTGSSGSGNFSDGVLLKLASNGNTQWLHTMSPPAYTLGSLTDLGEVGQGDYLVANRGGAASGPPLSVATLERYRPSGQLVSSRGLPSEAQVFSRTTDGGVVMLRFTPFTFSTPQTLTKVNQNGDSLWSYSLAAEQWSQLKGTPDGGCVAVGFQNNGDGALVKLDANGNLEWSRTFSDSLGRMNLYNVGIAYNGGYLLSGRYHPDSSSAVLYSYFLRVDAQGQYISTTTIATPSIELRLFPNPTNSDLTVVLAQVPTQALMATITDVQGRPLRTFTLQDQQTKLSVNNWPTGLYFLHIHNPRLAEQRTYPFVKN